MEIKQAPAMSGVALPLLNARPMETSDSSGSTRRNSGKVVAFVLLVVIVAGLAALGFWGLEIPVNWAAMFLLATLAAIGGAAPVRIPALKTSVSATDPFVFTALGALGPLPACLISAVGVLAAALRKPPARGPIQLVFNLGNVVLSTSLASAAYLLLGGQPGGPIQSQLWPLAVGTTVYFLTNTVLVTVAIVLDTGGSVYRTWKETGLWTAVSTYAGMTLATGLLLALREVGAVGLALGVPPCWLLATFYRTHKERHEEQQQRIEQIQQLNHQLESKVTERTQELQHALSHIESANSRLRMANERLIEANRAKSEFLANVSHELRTPLNAIIGFSELLRDKGFGDLNVQQGEFVKDIYESGDHLLNLINSILDLSKIEAGRMELRLSRCDLSQAIREAVAMVRPQASRKQLMLEVDCAADVTAGEMDSGMFRQVLVNLLSNAVKFTPAAGLVRVLARRDDQDLVVHVQDTGIGISDENQKRIFEEFYQVDGSYSRSYEGTGLGLALVRRLVEMHNGSVSVDSEVGRGSRFTCRFPACLCEPSAAELPEQPELTISPVRNGQSILVVEDNPVNRKLVRNALRSRGFQVFEACSGEDALTLLKQSRPDLVLMDIQLPGMDGLEVTRRLRSDPQTASLPVVALTAHVQQVDEERARQAGCVGYISKPIRLSSFPGQVEAYLSPRGAVA